MTADYLDRLSDWAAIAPLEDLPPAVRERAALVIADSLAVTVHGMQVPEMRALVARHLAEPRPGRASVIGAGRRADPASAALLNGTAGTWIDMNEGNLHANGHPGIQVIPLAWALAEQDGRSGRDLLAAFVVGYEVSARIKRASRPGSPCTRTAPSAPSGPRWRWRASSATIPPPRARSST